MNFAVFLNPEMDSKSPDFFPCTLGKEVPIIFRIVHVFDDRIQLQYDLFGIYEEFMTFTIQAIFITQNMVKNGLLKSVSKNSF